MEPSVNKERCLDSGLSKDEVSFLQTALDHIEVHGVGPDVNPKEVWRTEDVRQSITEDEREVLRETATTAFDEDDDPRGIPMTEARRRKTSKDKRSSLRKKAGLQKQSRKKNRK